MSGEFTDIVPCGKCPPCLKRKSASWSFRIYQEMKVSYSAFFVTLTYAEAPLSRMGKPTLSKKHFQDFMKRLRKNARQRTVHSLKYYACGEYGTTTQRPHYHLIIFNLPIEFQHPYEMVLKSWGHGHIAVDPCNMATIHYTTKYLQKGTWKPDEYVDEDTGEIYTDDRYREFSLMSKKMGLTYLTTEMTRYHKDQLIGCITQKGGYKTAMPRYFKEKIFTKDERGIIAERDKLIAEQLHHERFRSPIHEIEYKKELSRKHELDLLQKRNTI